MIRQVAFCSLFMMFSTNVLFANNLGNCQDRGANLMKGCSFGGYTMWPSMKWPDLKPFVTTFTVTYDYRCEGHDLDIGLRAGGAFVKFERGGVHTATVEGMEKGEVIDRNPDFTQNRALLKKGCVLDILSSTMEPATSTLVALSDKARMQAKVIDMAVQLFQMSESWTRLATWSQNELVQMKDELELLRDIADSPEDLDKLIRVIDLALLGSPVPPDLGQSDRNVTALKNYLLSKLSKEIEAGQAIVQQFNDFEKPVDASLEQSLDKAQDAAHPMTIIPV